MEIRKLDKAESGSWKLVLRRQLSHNPKCPLTIHEKASDKTTSVQEMDKKYQVKRIATKETAKNVKIM